MSYIPLRPRHAAFPRRRVALLLLRAALFLAFGISLAYRGEREMARKALAGLEAEA